jgi:hypothetical protein
MACLRSLRHQRGFIFQSFVRSYGVSMMRKLFSKWILNITNKSEKRSEVNCIFIFYICKQEVDHLKRDSEHVIVEALPFDRFLSINQ